MAFNECRSAETMKSAKWTGLRSALTQSQGGYRSDWPRLMARAVQAAAVLPRLLASTLTEMILAPDLPTDMPVCEYFRLASTGNICRDWVVERAAW